MKIKLELPHFHISDNCRVDRNGSIWLLCSMSVENRLAYLNNIPGILIVLLEKRQLLNRDPRCSTGIHALQYIPAMMYQYSYINILK